MVHLTSGAIWVDGAKPYNPGTKSSCAGLFQTPDGDVVKNTLCPPERARYEFFMECVWYETLKEYEKRSGIAVRTPQPTIMALGGIDPESNQIEGDKGGIASICSKKIDGIPGSRLEKVTDGSITITYKESFPGPRYNALAEVMAYHLGAFTKIRRNERMIHGDLDPRNIKIDQNGPVLYVLDFSDSRKGTIEMIDWENERLLDLLSKMEDVRNIAKAFRQGVNDVPRCRIFSTCLQSFSRKNGIDFNFETMTARPRSLL